MDGCHFHFEPMNKQCPTERFAILDTQNALIDGSEQHKTRRPTVLEAQNYENVQSGIFRTSLTFDQTTFDVCIKGQKAMALKRCRLSSNVS